MLYFRYLLNWITWETTIFYKESKFKITQKKFNKLTKVVPPPKKKKIAERQVTHALTGRLPVRRAADDEFEV